MKHTTLKRLIALLTTALLLAVMLPALALAEEEIPVIKVFGRQTGNEWENYFLVKEIEKRFNIKIKANTYPNDAYETQLTLLMAQNDMPDMLWNVWISRANANAYGQDGYLLDVSKYLHVMPNFSAALEAFPELNAVARDEFGSIYGFSEHRDSNLYRLDANCFIKNSWLENVGMSMPTTLDELYDVLVAFKEQDANGNGDPNDEIPFCTTINPSYAGVSTEYIFRTAFGLVSGNASNFVLQVDDAGKVYLGETTENYKAYLTFLRKLYAEGLLDQDCFIQNDDEFHSKVTEDKAGFFGSWTMLHSIFGQESEAIYKDYSYFMGVTSEYIDEITYPLYSGVTSSCKNAIGGSTKYPELLCQIVDYFYSPEGIELMKYGVEGETFDYVEGFQGMKIAKYDGYWEDKGYDSASAWRVNEIYINHSFNLVSTSPLYTMVANASDEDLVRFLEEDEAGEATWAIMTEMALRSVKLAEPFPNLTFTTAESTERATLYTDLDLYIRTMKAQFIIGEVDIETEWDNFIATLNTMGLERVLEITQAAYDRYAANL